jgi:hypothetical protein
MSAAATVKAVSLAVDLLVAATELTTRLQGVSAMLQKAQAEGRDLTEAELQSLMSADDVARVRLQKAIDGA